MNEKIEITVKVNGETVPLSSISAETFEKIKKAEELKSLPVATVCDYNNERRLLLRLPNNLVFARWPDAKAVAINLETGEVVGWTDIFNSDIYRNKQAIR